MDRYIWESERDMHSAIGSLITLTDKPNYFDCILPNYDLKVFKYKYIGDEVCRFDLWYYFALSKFSYQPAPIFGTISATKDGCKIEIEPLRLVTIACYIYIPLVVTISYIIVVTSLVFRDAGWIPFSILFGVLGTFILSRFYSRAINGRQGMFYWI